jgi:hypothetical protein
MAWGHTTILQFAFCNLTFALLSLFLGAYMCTVKAPITGVTSRAKSSYRMRMAS